MQSIDLEEIKAALWEQASHLCTRVSWGTAQVMAARRRKGQLLVLLRGFSRWHPVESVTISRPRLCPTGACDIREEEDEPDDLGMLASNCTANTTIRPSVTFPHRTPSEQ